ncbi:hypothetical protein ACPV3A_24355 [Paenibacillus sp. Dod16]|uniref:hypothetical protein n=1 Tax=Paenibacillus sp. Dod16 TaxID=3416392 RepID=UPI003CE728D4
MSLISVIAKENYCCVMSDGRVVDQVTKEVIQEDFQKFINHNNRSFIAYAGGKDIIDMLVNNIEIKTNEFDLWLATFQQTFQELELRELYNIDPLRYKVLLLFGGRNEKNEIELYSISSITGDVQHYLPKDDQVAVTFLCSGNVANHSDIMEFMGANLRSLGHRTPSDALSIMKLTNTYVSNIDWSVGKKTYRMVIK